MLTIFRCVLSAPVGALLLTLSNAEFTALKPHFLVRVLAKPIESIYAITMILKLVKLSSVVLQVGRVNPMS